MAIEAALSDISDAPQTTMGPRESYESLSSVERRAALAENRYYEAGAVSKWKMFKIELWGLLHGMPLILWRAWTDTKARYRRSMLGPNWLTIGTITFVAGYSMLAGLLFRRPLEDFLGYIAAGVIAWQLISIMMTEGSKVFVANQNEIQAVRTNMLSLPLKLLLRGLIGFAHSLPIVLFVVFFTDAINLNTLMFIPGLLLLCVTLVPVVAGLGALAARFRDIEQLVAMLIQFLFYMTPILWKAEMLGDGWGRWLALGNPFFYALTIVRSPLLGQPVALEVWLGAIIFAILGNVVGYTIFLLCRQRLPFWI